MKSEKKKHIKDIAKQIARLERCYQSGTDISKTEEELEQLVRTLSLEEMLEIDEYILRKNLLTK